MSDETPLWKNPVVVVGVLGLIGTISAAFITGLFGLLGDSATTESRECTVAGTVYDYETGEPLRDIDVYLFVPGRGQGKSIENSPKEYRVARTDAEGHYHADCSNIAAELFPLQLALGSNHWYYCIWTDSDEVQASGAQTGLNLYPNDRLQRLYADSFVKSNPTETEKFIGSLCSQWPKGT